MPQHPGDLAVQLADEYMSSWLATLDDDMLKTLDEVKQFESAKRRSIFTKMDMRWRPSDKAKLEQVRVSAEKALDEYYQIATAIMDEFYGQMRLPEVDEETGMTRLDSHRRVIFQRDQWDHYVEDINQLTGQDIEKAILDMRRVRFIVSRLHAQLLSEAILAKHLYDDAHSAGYESLVEGTQGDRTARASRESRRAKYKAYFHWHLYQLSNAFLIEINDFIRTLDRMVDRRAWSGSRRES